MITLLEWPDRTELRAYAQVAHGYRGYTTSDVCPNEHPPHPEMAVGRVETVEEAERWIRECLLDTMHADYLAMKPKPSLQRDARDRYLEARRAVQQAERDTRRAERRLRNATARVVRTHGRGPVEIAGVTYDPGYRGSRGEKKPQFVVYLIPRKK